MLSLLFHSDDVGVKFVAINEVKATLRVTRCVLDEALVHTEAELGWIFSVEMADGRLARALQIT